MKNAPKTKPKNIHLLKGTFRKDRHGDPGEKINVRNHAPKMPGHLCEEAKKEWRRVVRELKHVGVLTPLDRCVLTQYCQLWAEMMDQGDEFPASKHTQLRMCAAELGLSPSSRTSLTPATAKKPQQNPFDEFKRTRND